jgi:hypothetical protein
LIFFSFLALPAFLPVAASSSKIGMLELMALAKVGRLPPEAGRS